MSLSMSEISARLKALPYRLFTRPVGPFQMNMSSLVDPASGEAVLIDVGEDPSRWVREQEEVGGELSQVWQTHAHIDHVTGLPLLAKAGGPAPLLHPLERPIYEAQATYAAMAYGIELAGPLPEPRYELEDGGALHLGEHRFDVMHTPGHAPGHVIFVDSANRLIIGGDLLFAGSIGRTDLPGSDHRQMIFSLHKIMTLDDDHIVISGHGPATTIGTERRHNPFIRSIT